MHSKWPFSEAYTRGVRPFYNTYITEQSIWNYIYIHCLPETHLLLHWSNIWYILKGHPRKLAIEEFGHSITLNTSNNHILSAINIIIHFLPVTHQLSHWTDTPSNTSEVSNHPISFEIRATNHTNNIYNIINTLLLCSTLAPALIKYFIQSKWPFSEALIRGVVPSYIIFNKRHHNIYNIINTLLLCKTSAPFSINNFMHSKWPSLEAYIRGVQPSYIIYNK